MFPGSNGTTPTRFYSNSRDTATGGTSSQFCQDTSPSSMAAVNESLGHISGQISSMQQCLLSLTSNVDGLLTKTMELTTRIAAIEDITIESQPAKKRRIDVPRDLSVSVAQYIASETFLPCTLLIDTNQTYLPATS